MVVGSLNVRALYPSLDQEESADMVAQMVMRSRARISGVDYRAAQVFLASNLDPDSIKKEGLEGLLPRRMHRRGNQARTNHPDGTISQTRAPLGRTCGGHGGVQLPPPKPDGDPSPQGSQHEPVKANLSKWRATNPERDLDDVAIEEVPAGQGGQGGGQVDLQEPRVHVQRCCLSPT